MDPIQSGQIVPANHEGFQDKLNARLTSLE